MNPTIGRIVLYKLTKENAAQINVRRTTGSHTGNMVSEHQEFPMVIVRTWGADPASQVNGAVILDGSDTFWAQFSQIGDNPPENEPGTWRWPTLT